MKKIITIFTLSSIVILLQAEAIETRSLCVDETLKKILKTESSKKERPVIFNQSADDEELHLLMQQIVLKKNNRDFLVADLDTIWDWDRKNGMKFIYKLLDLMNRNYEIDSVQSPLKGIYIQQANGICEGLN
jgi:hypothetical protein